MKITSRFDKKCGKSGIPANAKCTKTTTASQANNAVLRNTALKLGAIVGVSAVARNVGNSLFKETQADRFLSQAKFNRIIGPKEYKEAIARLKKQGASKQELEDKKKDLNVRRSLARQNVKGSLALARMYAKPSKARSRRAKSKVRADKKCGKSGIPANAKCTKTTSVKANPLLKLAAGVVVAGAAQQAVGSLTTAGFRQSYAQEQLLNARYRKRLGQNAAIEGAYKARNALSRMSNKRMPGLAVQGTSSFSEAEKTAAKLAVKGLSERKELRLKARQSLSMAKQVAELSAVRKRRLKKKGRI